ncbi:MAG: pseudouridine synthase [Bacillota bacterium]|jgi:16S rRNA pseudouridine516 synthase|nr:pseudouridine synthase [Bacillota bacterium]
MSLLRLDKLLSNTGHGSRKEVKKLIRAGRVRINENLVLEPSNYVDPKIDKVYLDGDIVIYEKYHYIMLNKPAGVISATEDKRHRTVLDLLPKSYKDLGLFPVGRLDKDTEGLLILTNDGNLAHSLLSPKKQVPKTYYARIRGRVENKDIHIFKSGISLGETFTTLPAELEILESGQESKVMVTIFEGKYHQVKRMFKAVGKEVTYLKRVSMGNLFLDKSLEPGSFRKLTSIELKSLQE